MISILNTIHQIFMTHVIYVYLITEHFNVAYLGVVVWWVFSLFLTIPEPNGGPCRQESCCESQA